MAEVASERRLAAILAADVVGYSRLVEKDEAGTLASVRKLRSEVIDPLLAKHHGRIVKLMGDGAIAEFGSVVDAVSSAVALQKEVAAVQADVPAERRIVFRIGVNLGDVLVEGDDLLGDGVNVAARLQQLADPGGVLISGTAFDQLQGKFDVPLDFAGEQRVKNIARPVRTYRVRLAGGRVPWRLRFRQYRKGLLRAAALVIAAALIGASAWWLQPVEPASASTSIAVLPFDNLGGDEQTGRLADGITEDIITDLSRFNAIEVIARNSVEVYKDRAVDIRQVGNDLNARFVLEGSIQRQSDRVRITAQLIEAESGRHIWSDRWDRPVADVFAVQTELAEHVAAKIAGDTGLVIAADREAAKRKRPSNLTAYDLYLLGSAALYRDSEADNNEAIALLKRSLDVDPGLARAWTALSFAYFQLTDYVDSAENRRLGREAAQRAVQLDPRDANARAALAWQLGTNGDSVKSEIEFERALELNPNSADILTYYAGFAGYFDDSQEGRNKAVELAERAIRLNPNGPLWAYGIYRIVYFDVGRYEEAWRWHQQRLRTIDNRWDYLFSAILLAELGRLDEARAAVAENLAKFPDTSIEGWMGTPDFAGTFQRKLYTASMRKAGFPVCATENQLKAFPDLVRMPECLEAQAAPN
jgi:TolB-like protein/class 3 adenylate cyclase/cytochrome c-type biogenesis protein CcmH/NrfG